jgi:hypothetical protein
MTRLRLAAAILLLVPAAAAACGGDDDAPADATPTVSEADARRTEVAQGLEQPVPPDKPLPTPTPVPDDLPIVQVVSGSNQLLPTRAEFGDLPTATISAAGKQFTGVTIGELARRVSAPEAALVTIQGTRIDNLRYGAIRYPLAEIAANTVVYLDESGYLRLASSSIPEEQWLHTITGIAIN